MMSKRQITELQGWALAVGMLLIFVSAAMPIMGVSAEWISALRYSFAAGAAMVLLVRITEVYPGKDHRLRRLHMLEKLSAVCYCVAAFFTFYRSYDFSTDWAGLLSAGVVLQLYTMIVIPRVEKKIQEKDK